MTGIEIEFLLGLFFLVTSLTSENGKFTADAIRLVAGILFLILAVIGFSPIH